MNLDRYFLDGETPVDCPPLDDAAVTNAERRLGFRLPGSYVRLLRSRNGGYLRRTIIGTAPTDGEAWPHRIILLFGLGGAQGIDVAYSGSTTLNRFLIAQWGYPEKSVVFSHAGHGGYVLDYTLCGAEGEPRVVFHDIECPEHDGAVVAEDFSTFLCMLQEE